MKEIEKKLEGIIKKHNIREQEIWEQILEISEKLKKFDEFFKDLDRKLVSIFEDYFPVYTIKLTLCYSQYPYYGIKAGNQGYYLVFRNNDCYVFEDVTEQSILLRLEDYGISLNDLIPHDFVGEDEAVKVGVFLSCIKRHYKDTLHLSVDYTMSLYKDEGGDDVPGLILKLVK